MILWQKCASHHHDSSNCNDHHHANCIFIKDYTSVLFTGAAGADQRIEAQSTGFLSSLT